MTPSATHFPLLTVTLLLPLAGALAIALIPKESTRLIRVAALLSTVVTFVVSLFIVFRFNASVAAPQLVDQARWVPQAGATFHLGVDGISLWLVILTTFLMPASVLVSQHVGEKVKAFHIVLLILETSLLGSSSPSTWHCSTSSGRRCSSRCTSSSASGATSAASTPP